MFSDDTMLVLVAQQLDLLSCWPTFAAVLGGVLAGLAYLEWEPKR